MKADRRNDKLATAADAIIAEHNEILSLMATAEDRAKAIGQKLMDLKPELKARGTNLTEFCRDYLPFSKTTAYDYIKISKGKLSWSDHVGRGNSESSEKATADAIAKRIANHLYQTQDVDTITSLILCAFPDTKDLQHAHSVYINGAED